MSGPVLYGSHGKFGLGSLSPGQVASVKEGSRGGVTCVQVVRGKSRFVKVRQLRQGRLVQVAQGPCPVR